MIHKEVFGESRGSVLGTLARNEPLQFVSGSFLLESLLSVFMYFSGQLEDAHWTLWTAPILPLLRIGSLVLLYSRIGQSESEA